MPSAAPATAVASAPAPTTAAAAADPLPDLSFTVHDLQLDAATLRRLQRERKPHVWVEVDPLGLSDELGLQLRSRRVRAVTQTVGVSLEERVPLEPSEPLWAPIIEALRSEEEQDSDVYFVVRAGEAAEHIDEGGEAGSDGAASSDDIGIDIGTGHINLEELLRRDHEPAREAVAVVSDATGPVGSLTLSVGALAAMRFAKARLAVSDSAAAAGERLGFEVAVHSISLNADAMMRLEDVRAPSHEPNPNPYPNANPTPNTAYIILATLLRTLLRTLTALPASTQVLRDRKVKVEVDLPDGMSEKPLVSKVVAIKGGKAAFKYNVSLAMCKTPHSS